MTKTIRSTLLLATLAAVGGFVLWDRAHAGRMPGLDGCESIPDPDPRVTRCVVARPFAEYRKEVESWARREGFEVIPLTDQAFSISRGTESATVAAGRMQPESPSSFEADPKTSSVIYTRAK